MNADGILSWPARSTISVSTTYSSTRTIFTIAITNIATTETGDKRDGRRYIASMITQVKFVGIPVKDQQRALAFYRDILGFKVATDQAMGPGQRWIELRIGGAETRVVLFTPSGHEDRIGTFFNGSLQADNVQKTFEELKAKGVEFTQEPKVESWGISAMFKDSEGNQFVLSSK
jgi:predicted enzyme related to lactoylglutathione lyase